MGEGHFTYLLAPQKGLVHLDDAGVVKGSQDADLGEGIEDVFTAHRRQVHSLHGVELAVLLPLGLSYHCGGLVWLGLVWLGLVWLDGRRE